MPDSDLAGRETYENGILGKIFFEKICKKMQSIATSAFIFSKIEKTIDGTHKMRKQIIFIRTHKVRN